MPQPIEMESLGGTDGDGTDGDGRLSLTLSVAIPMRL